MKGSGASIKRALLIICIISVVLYCVVPFLWQMITSVRPSTELSYFKSLLPEHYTFEHYINVFKGKPFERYIINSVVIAVATTTFCVLIGALAAYALANMKIKGKKIFLAFTLVVSMFPQISIVTSLYKTFSELSLLNTYTGLVLAYIALNLPLSIWIQTSFFKEIQYSLIEAAKVDGCTSIHTLIKIIMPIAIPGMFAAAILIFISSWNEFLFALTFTSNIKTQTVPVGIANLPVKYFVPWGDMAAASIIVTIPLIAIVFVFQKNIIQGLSAGSVKG